MRVSTRSMAAADGVLMFSLSVFVHDPSYSFACVHGNKTKRERKCYQGVHKAVGLQSANRLCIQYVMLNLNAVVKMSRTPNSNARTQQTNSAHTHK